MKRITRLILFLIFLSSFFLNNSFLAYAVIDGDPSVALEKAKIHLQDKESISRGAKFFAQTCMVCHTLKYLAHDPIAEKAGITLDKMPLKNTNWWLGIVPPDLTLMARVKGPNWLYTYFHSFYKDPKRPTGYNNLVAKDVNMMNIFAGLQGEQELSKDFPKILANEFSLIRPHYYSMLTLVKAGSMTPNEFDKTMTDLVDFLVYASEPEKNERRHIGVWVLLYLVILFVLAYLLKKIYWRNIK